MTIELSIITPCFNEEATITECVDRTLSVMQTSLPGVEFEHIFCDNASTDNTFEILKRIAEKNPHIKVVRNSRNVGPFRNMYRGLEKASGQAIIPMLPADLQDPPEVIPEFYHEWEKGNQVVFGVRTNRQESLILRTLRGIYYRVIRRFAEGEIPINSGEFMLVDKKIIKPIVDLKDHYPYIRGLVAQSVSRSASVPYVWEKRKAGNSKANFVALIDQGMNGLISTSRVPARLALLCGFIFSGIGIAAGLWSLVVSLFFDNATIHGIPTLVVGLFFFGGIQMFFLGLIGEYVLSIHAQVRKLPEAFDESTINL